MVRNASGAFSTVAMVFLLNVCFLLDAGSYLLLSRIGVGVDALLEDGRWLEYHHPPRRDRHFLTGFGIAADALAFLAHHERAERGQLHRFAAFQAIGDL